MARCPECGGEMTSFNKRKICQTCGLSLTGTEYDRMWERNRDSRYDEEDQKQRRNKDYMRWYRSSKKNEE